MISAVLVSCGGGGSSGDSSVVPVVRVSTVSTLAGTGTGGFVDGPGTTAKFSFPVHVAVDSSGYVYVVDRLNSAIRVISPAGLVSTLAGGTQGFVNGSGPAASFYNPTGIAVDSLGNLYVGDTTNNAVRVVTPAGLVTTLAGGSQGFTNATGLAASFSSPNGVAIDSAGNVYVADTDNNAIRKIAPSGLVSTLAGNGATGFTNAIGTAASFNKPTGVAVDASGNVYVADRDNYAIRKISSVGLVSTLALNPTVGLPVDVAVDGMGNVYVADLGSTIRKISTAGVVSTLAGSNNVGFVDGAGTTAKFNNPYGVAVDGMGVVYVADSGNYSVRKIVP